MTPNDALGELGAVFGIHIAPPLAKFGIDIEDQLAIILPAEVDDAGYGSDEPGGHAFGDPDPGQAQPGRPLSYDLFMVQHPHSPPSDHGTVA